MFKVILYHNVDEETMRSRAFQYIGTLGEIPVSRIVFIHTDTPPTEMRMPSAPSDHLVFFRENASKTDFHEDGTIIFHLQGFWKFNSVSAYDANTKTVFIEFLSIGLEDISQAERTWKGVLSLAK